MIHHCISRVANNAVRNYYPRMCRVRGHAFCQSFIFLISELETIPILPSEAGNHTFRKGGNSGRFQGRCIVASCSSSPTTFCEACTRDVPRIVYVCKPSATKQCWNILHQARCPHPVDQQGSPVDPPKLTRKRRRNSSLGTERVPRAQRKALVLNPHHTQLED